MKRILLLIAICGIFLSGCTVKVKKPSEKIKSISAAELIEKSKSSDDLSFVITLKDCPMCDEFFSYMDSNETITIDYEVKLDKNDKDYKSDLKILHDAFPDIEATPEIYIKKKNEFIRYPDEIDNNKLIKWFKKYK